jgi:uncharacterized tellurite resistance protein B-like protein
LAPALSIKGRFMVLDKSVLRRSNALQEMLDLARSIVADDEVSEREAKAFQEWIDRNPDMLGVWPVGELTSILRDAFADGRLSESEKEQLRSLLNRVAGKD